MLMGIRATNNQAHKNGPDQSELLVLKNALVGNNQASCSEDLPAKQAQQN